MDTQCKSCGSVKFEYKEGKKVCAYCGRELYDSNFEMLSVRNFTTQLETCGHLYTILDPYRTLTLK